MTARGIGFVVVLPGAMCAMVGTLLFGGARWWAVVMGLWLACFVVTMAMIWHEQRRWARVDDMDGRG